MCKINTFTRDLAINNVCTHNVTHSVLTYMSPSLEYIYFYARPWYTVFWYRTESDLNIDHTNAETLIINTVIAFYESTVVHANTINNCTSILFFIYMTKILPDVK